MKKVFLIFIVLMMACTNDDNTNDPIFCTEELRAGLEITVRDGVGGDFLVEGVEVTAIDGDYQETLQNFTGSNIFVGAFERTGSYTIIASKNGYADNSSSAPVIVNKDACHVITEKVEIILEKIQN